MIHWREVIVDSFVIREHLHEHIPVIHEAHTSTIMIKRHEKIPLQRGMRRLISELNTYVLIYMVYINSSVLCKTKLGC